MPTILLTINSLGFIEILNLIVRVVIFHNMEIVSTVWKKFHSVENILLFIKSGFTAIEEFLKLLDVELRK
ncbi:hypothetical protein QUF74_10750 [Candidatus Halobeggiatoa sp. HSG11]|nr:hypothetical protein [Candidatus Halobeggiatoa sp. HSG11]